MKVISVESEFWRDERNAENSGGMCSVEIRDENILACARVECAHVNEKLLNLILRGEILDEKTAKQPYYN